MGNTTSNRSQLVIGSEPGMNPDITITPVSETLSDGSKVWNVLIHHETASATVCVECVSESAALRLVNVLTHLFAQGGDR